MRITVWKILPNETKLIIQIMQLTCCLNMEFHFKYLNSPIICLHDGTDGTGESIAAQNSNMIVAFVRENFVRFHL